MSGWMPISQLADRLLRGFRLQLARRAQERQQRQVDEQDLAARLLERELTAGFQERQALDVARRAANLGDQHVDVGVRDAGGDARLDLVRDVRDDLDGRAQVVAAPLLGDHRRVDLARRVVRVLGQARLGEALVVTQVQVGLGAVVGDVHLAVLERTHRARVDVDVRVELLHRHLEAAALEDHADGARGQALAEARDDAAGDDDVLGHWDSRVLWLSLWVRATKAS